MKFYKSNTFYIVLSAFAFSLLTGVIIALVSAGVSTGVFLEEFVSIEMTDKHIQYKLEDGETFDRNNPFEVVETEKGKVIKIFVVEE